MSDDHRDFDDVLREIAKEVSRSLERISEIDIDGLAKSAGLDPDRGREWLDEASRWLQENLQGPLGPVDPDVPRPAAPAEAMVWEPTDAHPLDTPTPAQGAALAALDSGRWSIDPATDALTVHGEGPRPGDAGALVQALRARDWLRNDGTISLAGSRALERWLALTAE